MPRLIAGLALLLIWEVAVRLLAPPFVAKPTSVIAAAPRVLVDPVFLTQPAALFLRWLRGSRSHWLSAP